MVISFHSTFLPSFSDTETDPTFPDISPALFEGLLADPRFEDLRSWYPDPGLPEHSLIGSTTATPAGHPVHRILAQAASEERDVERTLVIAAIDADTRELPVPPQDAQPWLPAVGADARRQAHL